MNRKRSLILDIICIILLAYIGLTTKFGLFGKIINTLALIALLYSAYGHYIYLKNNKKS